MTKFEAELIQRLTTLETLTRSAERTVSEIREQMATQAHVQASINNHLMECPAGAAARFKNFWRFVIVIILAVSGSAGVNELLDLLK